MNKPNILMITCHDIGQHLGCYGVESLQTPNIDGLASQGVRFSQCYSTSAVCSPGRGSLHTGRYPQANGLMGLTHAPWWWKLNAGERHTASLMREIGYATRLIGVTHIDSDTERLGYDLAESPAHTADETVERAIALINESSGAEKPFFAKVGFFEVHRPFTHGSDTDRDVYVPPWLQDTEQIRNDLAEFQATIKYFDERVGEILDALASSGAAQNTLVIFTSDHGIPYPGAKWSVRKAGIEIPLIIYQPGTLFSGGSVVDRVVSNVDILPTLLDYLGQEIPEQIQGLSLLPSLEGDDASPARTHAFSQYTPEMKRDNLSRSVITDRYHLIRYFDQGRTVDYPVDVNPQGFAAHELRCRTTGARPFAQLFDIVKDPYELHDIGSESERTSIVDELSLKLLEWMEEVDDPLLEGPLRTPYYELAVEDAAKMRGSRS